MNVCVCVCVRACVRACVCVKVWMEADTVQVVVLCKPPAIRHVSRRGFGGEVSVCVCVCACVSVCVCVSE